MLFKSKVPEVMLSTYLEAKKGQEKYRKDKSLLRQAIYYDGWLDDLISFVKAQFQPKNYDAMKFSFNISQNVLKKIIGETSLVYKDPPVRKVDNDNANEIYTEILAGLGINTQFKEVNSLANLLNDMMVLYGWNEDIKQIEMKLLTPSVTSVIQDAENPERIAALYYEVELGDTEFNDGKKWFIYWDSENHYAFNEEGVKRAIPGNDEMVNPYGYIPVATIHMKKIPGLFWNDSTGNDMVDGTMINGLNKTLKNYLFKAQSFKQIWMRVQNEKDAPTAEMRSDPSSMFVVEGDESEVGVLDLTADFKALDASLKEDINGFLSVRGLSVESFSAVELSGKALRMKNATLMDIRSDQIDFFRKFEMDSFDIIRIIWNVHNDKNKIDEKAKFTIDYPELVFDEDPKEKRENADHDLSKGLITPGKYYMMFNPDIKTEEKAQALYFENLANVKKINELSIDLNTEIEEE